MKPLVALVVVVTLAIFGVVAVKHRGAGEVKSAQADSADSAGRPERQEVVVRHVFSMEPGPNVGAPTPPPAPVAEQDPAAMSPEKYAQDLDAAFRTDAPAGPAAKQTADSITSAFNTPNAKGATLQRVECHATRCRMEVQFDDLDSDKRIFKGIFELLSSNGIDTRGLGFVVPTRTTSADGKIEATVHLFHADDPSG
jgi:hypothetical protein